MKTIKLFTIMLVACSLSLITSTSVSATSISNELSPIFYQIIEDDEETPTVIQIPQAVTTPLTPSGNLTLVDDIETENEESKQFITVISKNGNYFYIIIDRENDKENVYFLNLVDEYDLLQLLGEEFSMPEPELVEVVVEKEVYVEPVVTETPQPVEQKSSSILPILLLLALGGGGAFYYFKFIKDKDDAPIDNDFDDDDDDMYVDDEEDDNDNQVDDEVE